MTKTVLVLGANGRLGRAAVLAFAAAGWQVRAQLRRAPRAVLPAGVRLVICDALDLPTLTAAVPWKPWLWSCGGTKAPTLRTRNSSPGPAPVSR